MEKHINHSYQHTCQNIACCELVRQNREDEKQYLCKYLFELRDEKQYLCKYLFEVRDEKQILEPRGRTSKRYLQRGAGPIVFVSACVCVFTIERASFRRRHSLSILSTLRLAVSVERTDEKNVKVTELMDMYQ
jgi:hypothetical protein